MHKQIPLSIIIPVYNAQNYLSSCLDSIISQSFKDWECILVDDGSKDRSGKICDDYAEKDSRFIVIHKENEGASIARNCGLDIAKGKWINFVDSDDYIDNITYEKVITTAELENADLVQWGISLESEGKIIKDIPCKNGPIEKDDLIDFFEPSTCHKLFLKSIICNKSIRFPERLSLSEDRFFSFLYYIYSSKIVGVKDCLYHYRIHPDSSTHKMTKRNLQDELIIINNMEKAIENNSSSDVYKRILIKQKIEAKNHALFLLENPDCVLWRSLYPEINKYLLKQNDKKVLLYIIILLRFDFIAKKIIEFYVK